MEGVRNMLSADRSVGRRLTPAGPRPLGVLAVVAGVLAAVAPLAGSTSVPEAGVDPAPNFVVVVTDDQRWDAIGRCWNGFDGHDLAAGADSCMPLLQQHLVGRGTTFLRGYVTTSLCCPARTGLLTGLYARHTGVLNNSDLDRFDDTETLATWLDRAGYRTALVGKYANGYGEGSSLPPNYVPPGWDSWHAFWGTPGYTTYSLVHRDPGQDPVTVSYSGDSTAPVACAPGVVYSTDRLCRHALDFLAADPDDPFFLYFAPFSPHLTDNDRSWPSRWSGIYARDLTLPVYPNFNQVPQPNPPSWLPRLPLSSQAQSIARTGWRAQLRSGRAVDDAIGALHQQLAAEGRLDRTVFIYLSDNSLARGEHRWTAKACEYEECHRVPFVVVCPPAVCPGATPGTVDREHLVLNIDVAPTIAELAGVTPPFPLDGRSLVPLLTDPAAPWRDHFLLEDHGLRPTNRPLGIVAVGPDGHLYKYVRFLDAAADLEMYDLTADPWELANLAGDGVHAALQAALAARLEAAEAGPVLQLTSAPPDATRRTTVTFAWSSDEEAGYTCVLDGGGAAPCGRGTAGSVTYDGLALGTHTFLLQAVDVDNNRSALPLRTFTVTDVLPPPTLTAAPGDPSGPEVSFSFVHDESGVTFSCSLDGGPFAPCASPTTYAGLGSGPHWFRVVARDGSGSTSEPASFAWTVDAVPPSVTLLLPADTLGTTTRVGASWSGTDDVGIARYDVYERVGTAGVPSLVRSSTDTRHVHPGTRGTTYCFQVLAFDAAGNVGASAERCRSVPHDDRDAPIAYSGPVTAVTASGAFESTLTVLNGPGQGAELRFTGRKYGLLVRQAPDAGMADVYVDGVLVRRVDLYASTLRDRRYLFQQALTDGPHTVTVRWAGASNPSSSGTAVYLDGIGTISQG